MPPGGCSRTGSSGVEIMKTEVQIYLDYKSATYQADQIEETGKRLAGLSSGQIPSLAENLSSAWKGENAELFLEQLRTLADRGKSLSDQIIHMAAVMRKTAKNIYDAEMKSLETARRRDE